MEVGEVGRGEEDASQGREEGERESREGRTRPGGDNRGEEVGRGGVPSGEGPAPKIPHTPPSRPANVESGFLLFFGGWRGPPGEEA